MSNSINRRKFLKDTSFSGAAVIFGSNLTGCIDRKETNVSSYNILKDVTKYRKFDTNAHINPLNGDAKDLLDNADRLGIQKMSVSVPIESGSMSPEQFTGYNDKVLKAVRQYPERLVGKLTLNPVFLKESFEEINRCVSQGMVGLKVFTQVKINDPLFFPIIEKIIDLKMIIQMHGECQLGVGGYRMKYDINERPNASIPEDFVDIAKRYPEAMFQFAHIAGGGDWEYGCKAFKEYPNIYVDVSGSNNEEDMIDFAIKYLGDDRIFFGTDGSYYQSVGKILASNTTESQKEKIFFENYNNILKKSGRNIT
jgi:uncharacterized protein